MAETVQPFVCGGTAACFASTCIHPIDLAKVCVYSIIQSSIPYDRHAVLSRYKSWPCFLILNNVS